MIPKLYRCKERGCHYSFDNPTKLRKHKKLHDMGKLITDLLAQDQIHHNCHWQAVFLQVFNYFGTHFQKNSCPFIRCGQGTLTDVG